MLTMTKQNKVPKPWKALLAAAKEAVFHLDVAQDNAQFPEDRRLIKSCLKSLDKAIDRAEMHVVKETAK